MADITQQEFNQMLAVSIADGLGGGTYTSRWDGEQIDDGIDKVLLPGGIKTTELADGAVTWPKLAVEARPIRRNLLRNAYFIGGGSQQGGGQFPINQRGETSYGGFIYTIDGWYSYGSVELSIDTSGITLKKTGNNGQLLQRIPLSEIMVGRTYTLSFLINGQLYTGTDQLNEGSAFYAAGGEAFGWLACRILPGQPNCEVVVHIENAEQINITAAELVPGDQQTLAHQDANGNWVLNDPPPDFGLELAKCRYYYRKMGAGLTCLAQVATGIIFTFPFDGEMRISPTVTLLKNNFKIFSGSTQITLQNANIAEVFCTARGVAYIALAGEFSSELLNGAVYRYDDAEDLFAFDANL